MTSFLPGAVSAAADLFAQVVPKPTFVQFIDAAGTVMVEFDTTIAENYTYDAAPTSSPIEDGSSITDHVVTAPLLLDLVGIKADTSLYGQEALLHEASAIAASAVLPPFGVIAGAAAVRGFRAQKGSASPSQATYAQLVSIFQGAIPFTVRTKLGGYANMVIANLSAPRDVSVGTALIFTMRLAQLNIVSSQTLDVSDLDKPGLSSLKAAIGEKKLEEMGKFEPGRLAGNRDVGFTRPGAS